MTLEVVDTDDGDLTGDCTVCGQYRDQIAAGTMRPCWQWQKIGVAGMEVDDAETMA